MTRGPGRCRRMGRGASLILTARPVGCSRVKKEHRPGREAACREGEILE